MNLNIIKKVGITLVSLIVLFYIIFLLILPNIINLNTYKNDIQKAAKEYANLNVDFKNAKIITSPGIKAGLNIKNPDIKYNDGRELLYADGFEVKIALLPLLFKTIKIDSLTINTPVITLDVLESGKLKAEEYFLKNTDDLSTSDNTAAMELPFKLSSKLPDIKIKNYKVILNDLKSKNNITFSGEILSIDKAELNKHLRLVTKGILMVNSRDNVNYDIDIDTFLPKIEPVETTENKNVLIISNPISAFTSYDLKADIKTKLKIRKTKDTVKASGFFNAEKISLKIKDAALPQSYIKLNFDGTNINIDSNLYTADNQKASINGSVNYGKHSSADIRLFTNKIYLSNIKDIFEGILDSLNIKNELNKINVSGFIKSDFKINTDMNHLKSEGMFNITNASISHSNIPASIKKINTDIDFSHDKIQIKNCRAAINSALITAGGSINSDSTADITVQTTKLPIANLYNAFAPSDIKDSILLQDGYLSLNTEIKGKIDKIKPEIKLVLENMKLKEKNNNIIVSNKNFLINLTADKNGYKGTIDSIGSVLSAPSMNLSIQNPNLKINFDDKNILIPTSPVYFNSSKLDLNGAIKNYAKTPSADIILQGNLNTSDLLKIIPKESRSMFSQKGSIPVILQITGNEKKIMINAQTFANSNNYFSPVTINKLVNKNSLINLSAQIADNELNIKDIGIYELKTQDNLNDDLKSNLNNTYKIAQITGLISSLDKKNPYINEFKLHMPASLALSTPMIKDSKFNIKGSINAQGYLSKPELKGNLNISNVVLPDLMTKVQNIDLIINNSDINAKADNILINGSQLNIDADAKLDFAPVFTINKMNISSTNLDLDKILKTVEQMPQSLDTKQSQSMSNNIPMKINKGSGKIDKFKMGELIVTNVNGDFQLKNNNFKINNLTGKAYNGNIQGSVDYNLSDLALKADITGKQLDANPAVTAFLLIKDQLFGTLDFHAAIAMKGSTYEEQMKTLKGYADFDIKDGQMGSLGRFETFLRAGNLLSQSFISTTIGSVINTIAPYNTGEFKYLKGKIHFADTNAVINSVESSGSNMSLMIRGNYNLLNNNADISILGRISEKIANALGPLSNITADKILGNIPKIGTTAMTIFQTYTEKADNADLTKIPELTPKSDKTQTFRVIIKGNIANTSAVKSFKWLSTANEIQQTQFSLKEVLKPQTDLENSQMQVPKTKEEVIEQVKQNEKVQEKIQQIQQNEKVQKLQQFGAILKQYSDTSKNSAEN